MANAYLVLKWLHVLTASFLVGSFVTEWMLRSWAARAKEASVRAFTWDFLVKGEEKVAVPAAALLLLTGLLMVFGPAAGEPQVARERPAAGGLVGFLVILGLMVGLATASAKNAHAAHARGDAAAAAPHERRYALLAAIGLAIAAGVVWLMVAKPF